MLGLVANGVANQLSQVVSPNAEALFVSVFVHGLIRVTDRSRQTAACESLRRVRSNCEIELATEWVRELEHDRRFSDDDLIWILHSIEVGLLIEENGVAAFVGIQRAKQNALAWRLAIEPNCLAFLLMRSQTLLAAATRRCALTFTASEQRRITRLAADDARLGAALGLGWISRRARRDGRGGLT